MINTAAHIETTAQRIIDLYGHLPGKNAIGVFPSDDTPPIWVNVNSTRPTINLIAAELGYHVENVEDIDGDDAPST